MQEPIGCSVDMLNYHFFFVIKDRLMPKDETTNGIFSDKKTRRRQINAGRHPKEKNEKTAFINIIETDELWFSSITLKWIRVTVICADMNIGNAMTRFTVCNHHHVISGCLYVFVSIPFVVILHSVSSFIDDHRCLCPTKSCLRQRCVIVQ